MSSILLAGLSWTKPDGDQLFQGLDLSFGPERTGLVGRNGVGKTTLLKIIAGVPPPSAGSLSIEGKVVLVRHHCMRYYDAPLPGLLEKISTGLSVISAFTSSIASHRPSISCRV